MNKKEYFCPWLTLVESDVSDVILTSINDGDNFISDDWFND